jgi:imidazolonepropionase-like amidohydrolase
MTRIRLLLAALLLILGAPLAAQPAVTAFVRVNVLPMDSERALRDQTVLVSDGRVQAIGPRLRVPEGARIVDGHGTAWLLPGLADMHVHVGTRDELALLLANGITTALDLGEAPNAMVGRTRAAVARGDVPGPRLFVALAVDGSPRYGHLVVATPEAARWAARLAKANGYDFIKVYNGLSPEVFAALVAEGREVGLPVVGHTVESLGLERQIAGGQVMVAHLEEFIYSFFRLPEGADPNAAPADSEIARAVDYLRRTGTVVTADLATYQAIAAQRGRQDVVDAWLRLPEARYLAPSDRIAWRNSGYVRREGSLAARAAFLARFVDALADAGIPLISGTDAPTIPGLGSGFALHRNLAALEAAGLSRYQVLATATRAPGAFIAATHPETERFGTIAAGRRADLLLAAANPLDDLATLQRPLGVMAGGRWHDAAALQALLDGVAARYEGAAPRP